MKAKELNPTQDLELTYQPDFQDKPFIITGPYDAVMPIASDLEAVQAPTEPKTHKLASKLIKHAQTALEQPTELTGRRATIAAKFYDLTHGTDMYGLLKQKREDEADLAMARRLGLITTTFCQKHERALSELKSYNR